MYLSCFNFNIFPQKLENKQFNYVFSSFGGKIYDTCIIILKKPVEYIVRIMKAYN